MAKKTISKKKAPAKKAAVKKSAPVKAKVSKPIADLRNEKWIPMQRCDRKYTISDQGRIKSFYFDTVNGSLVKGKNVNGYLAMDIVYKGVRKMHYIHCLIAEHFLAKPAFKNAVVIHLDWKKENNKASNLQFAKPADAFVRTAKQNKKMAIKNGTYELTSKLKKEQVIKIKQALAKGVLQKQLAIKYKISEMQISRIAHGQSWSYVKV